jgi:hypothetical protein
MICLIGRVRTSDSQIVDPQRLQGQDSTKCPMRHLAITDANRLLMASMTVGRPRGPRRGGADVGRDPLWAITAQGRLPRRTGVLGVTIHDHPALEL